jgi:hypothetical protein
VEDIPWNNFFSYSAEKDFIYGMELSSIKKHIQTKMRNVLNPYNRELMDPVLPNIRKLLRLSKILDMSKTEFVEEKETPKPERRVQVDQPSATASPAQPVVQSNALTNMQMVSENMVMNIAHRAIYLLPEYNIPQMVSQIRDMRTKPFLERVQSLFMEIDQLGHYTQHQWFSQLTRLGYIRYFRCLRDIWLYRAQLSLAVKQKICPLWDPFTVLSEQIHFSNDLTDTQLQFLCISVMEDMIFTGIDNEYRMLGAFHVLSALTIVSIPARESMMWLYESVAY